MITVNVHRINKAEYTRLTFPDREEKLHYIDIRDEDGNQFILYVVNDVKHKEAIKQLYRACADVLSSLG